MDYRHDKLFKAEALGRVDDVSNDMMRLIERTYGNESPDLLIMAMYDAFIKLGASIQLRFAVDGDKASYYSIKSYMQAMRPAEENSLR